MSATDFYRLPEDVKARVIAAACQECDVTDWFDVPAEVRHRVYEEAGR